MLRVKICGITRPEDARAAVEAGADALGFNFWRPGRRYISPEEAAAIISTLPGSVWKVGVFVDEPPEAVLDVVHRAGLTGVQLHGRESPEYLAALGGIVKVKAFRMDQDFQIARLSAYAADAFLLDSPGALPGGNGAPFDWERAVAAKSCGRLVLAGGLTPDNVAEAVQRVRPWAVDVASGVEAAPDVAPGIKDPRLVAAFVTRARQAEAA